MKAQVLFYQSYVPKSRARRVVGAVALSVQIAGIIVFFGWGIACLLGLVLNGLD
jgi:hypothetical protein